jgi:hypothetical protein
MPVKKTQKRKTMKGGMFEKLRKLKLFKHTPKSKNKETKSYRSHNNLANTSPKKTPEYVMGMHKDAASESIKSAENTLAQYKKMMIAHHQKTLETQTESKSLNNLAERYATLKEYILGLKHHQNNINSANRYSNPGFNHDLNTIQKLTHSIKYQTKNLQRNIDTFNSSINEPTHNLKDQENVSQYILKGLEENRVRATAELLNHMQRGRKSKLGNNLLGRLFNINPDLSKGINTAIHEHYKVNPNYKQELLGKYTPENILNEIRRSGNASYV